MSPECFMGAVKNSCRFIIKKGGDFVKYIWQISPLLDGSFLIINGTGCIYVLADIPPLAAASSLTVTN